MANRNDKMIKVRKDGSGQIVLETAIVLASIAVIAVSSMALFANLNLNLMGRYETFKDSRLAAVNNRATATLPGNALNPLTYLDYSPNTTIIVPPNDASIGYFDPVIYEDARIQRAERLLDEADNIINILLPYKINQAYQLLGGDNDSYRFIMRRITRQRVTQARNLCNEAITAAQRAYNNFFGPQAAVALFQDVLDNPQVPGPFDNAPENAGNRQQLQSAIDGIMQAEPGLNEMLNNELIPRLRNTRSNLNLALRYWNREAGLWRLGRYNYILAAKRILRELINFMGALNTTPSASIASKIGEAYVLLVGRVDYNEAVQAKDICLELLQDPEISDFQSLKSLIQGAYNNLDNALKNWVAEQIREYYLGLARDKLEILNDIINI